MTNNHKQKNKNHPESTSKKNKYKKNILSCLMKKNSTLTLVLSITILILCLYSIYRFIPLVASMPNNNTKASLKKQVNKAVIDVFKVGHTYLASDNTLIYIPKPDNFVLYIDKDDYTKGYFVGKYSLYQGDEAINHIAYNLGEYMLSKEEQERIIRLNKNYDTSMVARSHYYSLNLQITSKVFNDLNYNINHSASYYAFIDTEQNSFSLTNLSTSNHIALRDITIPPASNKVTTDSENTEVTNQDTSKSKNTTVTNRSTSRSKNTDVGKQDKSTSQNIDAPGPDTQSPQNTDDVTNPATSNSQNTPATNQDTPNSENSDVASQDTSSSQNNEATSQDTELKTPR